MDRLEIAIGNQLGDLTIDLELGVDPGQTVALLGPSGAGKSSVLRAIAGLLQPARGHVHLGAHCWFDAAEGINLSPEERSVGLVFQDYALFPHMTVLENVQFASADAAPEMLKRFGVGKLAEAMPSSLSGGERQRVALARALARDNSGSEAAFGAKMTLMARRLGAKTSVSPAGTRSTGNPSAKSSARVSRNEGTPPRLGWLV